MASASGLAPTLLSSNHHPHHPHHHHGHDHDLARPSRPLAPPESLRRMLRALRLPSLTCRLHYCPDAANLAVAVRRRSEAYCPMAHGTISGPILLAIRKAPLPPMQRASGEPGPAACALRHGLFLCSTCMCCRAGHGPRWDGSRHTGHVCLLLHVDRILCGCMHAMARRASLTLSQPPAAPWPRPSRGMQTANPTCRGPPTHTQLGFSAAPPHVPTTGTAASSTSSAMPPEPSGTHTHIQQ